MYLHIQLLLHYLGYSHAVVNCFLFAGSTVGEIVNLMSVDVQKLADSPMFLQVLWSSPIQISLAMFFLWTTLGPSIIAGVVVLLTLIPTNILILRTVKKLQVKQMKLKDRRVKLMSEILSGMKVSCHFGTLCLA